MNRQYLKYAVLALTIVFVSGLSASFAAQISPVKPNASTLQSSGGSVTHFINPPTFDSGWVNITDKCGQSFNITHNLNTVNVTVDITGKTTLDGGAHQRNYGGTGSNPGWSQVYGGTETDRAYSVIQTSDGGYALAGYTYSSGAGYGDFWLFKTDSVGNMQWNQTWGGTSNDFAFTVMETGDGGYAVAGYTNSFGAGATDFWLIKTDSVGNMQWNQTYGGPMLEYAYSAVETSDGGYALTGWTQSYGVGWDAWLVKTDSAGNVQWNQTYGGTEVDYAMDVIQTEDGGYAMAGRATSFGAGLEDFWLIKTDSVGNMQWNQTYGGTGVDYVHSVVQTSDGGYALAGSSNSFGGGYDGWLVKTDSAGNMQWNRTYGDWNNDHTFPMVETGDEGYALVGYTGSYGAGDWDFWLIKTDSAGNMQWNQTYGGIGHDYAWSVAETGDGGFAVAGYTHSFGAGGQDAYLVKTGVESGVTWADSTVDTITLHRGETDVHWNFVRVRVWTIEEPTWQFGDINQDGVVDQEDLFILAQNYGVTLSGLGLGGITAVAGVYIFRKRRLSVVV